MNPSFIKIFDFNDSFCVNPWINYTIFPDGDVIPCCNMIKNNDSIIGNVNDNNLEEIMNGEKIKNIRQEMLNGKKIKVCEKCYLMERINKKSYRVENNFNHNDIKKRILDNKNININFNDILIIDFRLTNKCNFTCRTCNYQLSSSWEKKIINNNLKFNKPIKKINDINLVLKYIKDEKIKPKIFYFAGGEPLISDFHWEIIDFLIKKNRFDVRIFYNTNLSRLTYKNNNFIDKLKLFKTVEVSASCDSLGIKGEYIRNGFNHETFMKNISLLKENNFKISITTVVSFLNIIYLNDFFNDLINNDINIKINYIIINDKFNYNIYNLPINVFNRVLTELDKILENNKISIDNKNFINSLKNDLLNMRYFNENEFKILISMIKKQDIILNENKIENSLPELYELIKDFF
jgi:radical SAM protein with 4Fe4S-binding SPASM domain